MTRAYCHYESLADDGTLDIGAGLYGVSHNAFGDDDEWVSAYWGSAASPVGVTWSANIRFADTDTFACVFDNGTAVQYKNRLGSAKYLRTRFYEGDGSATIANGAASPISPNIAHHGRVLVNTTGDDYAEWWALDDGTIYPLHWSSGIGWAFGTANKFNIYTDGGSNTVRFENQTGAQVTVNYETRQGLEWTMADDATQSVTTSEPGWIIAFTPASAEAGGFEYFLVRHDSAGNLSPVDWSANVAFSDTDTKFCIYNSAANTYIVKNRLGAERTVYYIFGRTVTNPPDFDAKPYDQDEIGYLWEESADTYPDHYVLDRQINSGTRERLRTTGAWSSSGAGLEITSSINDARCAVNATGLSDGAYDGTVKTVDSFYNESSGTAHTTKYLDEPVIQTFTIDNGAGTATSRGVTCQVTLHSGTDSGSVSEIAHQVKFWNNGEIEADAPWQEYISGADYDITLTAGNGAKTVYCRARHECGQESTSSSAAITLAVPAAAAAASYSFERIIIAYGSGNPDYNFTGDQTSRISADSEDADFEVENVQQYDLGAVWRSSSWGTAAVDTPAAGWTTYSAHIVWNLSTSPEIGVFAVLHHNFDQMARLVGSAPHGDITVKLEYGSGVYSTVVDFSDVLAWDTLVHRPEVSAQYWRLTMSVVVDNGVSFPSDYPTAWEVGRCVLNESSLCWQPSTNYGRNWTYGRVDPSIISHNQGQARRAVEKTQYHVADIAWNGSSTVLSRTDHESLTETIYKRQGAVRPVFVILDPHNVNTGLSNNPASGDTIAKTVYGYLPDSLDLQWGVNDLGACSLRIEEAAG